MANRLPTEQRKCDATTNAGKPCPSPALKNDVQCFWHADSTRQEAQIARMVGAKSSSRVGRNFKSANIVLDTPADWLIAIAALMKDVASLPSSVNRVAAFVSLSREAREWVVMKHAMESRAIEGRVTRR
jgi:predicted YcjX-like family ATPase